MTDNYDSPWKRALKHNLPDFLAFYFPQYWSLINLRRPMRFRDKELEAARGNAQPGRLNVDLLVSVFLHDGREILLHIEVQCQRDSTLPRRIFDYNYNLLREHNLPVVSLVVLADPGKRWRRDAFRFDLLGTELEFRFAVVKLASYAELVDELLLDKNVFAWVTAAHLLAQQTHGDVEARYIARWRLTRLLYKRGWHKRRIIELFLVVCWLMPVPVDVERRLCQNVRRLERRHAVEYFSPFEELLKEKIERGEKRGERRGERRGEKRGEERGIALGRQKGCREGAEDVLVRLLRCRFGELSPTVQKRLARASQEQLAQWAEAVLDAQTLKQVFSART